MADYLRDLAACVDARWRPRIGDPTAMGWATVAAYALAAFLAAAAWRARRRAPDEAGFWLAAAVGLAALAVNKQLDLQSALTAIGRCEARLHGWYEARRGVQAAFVAALAACALAFGLWLARRLRHAPARLRVAALGVVVLLGFVLIRAVGFHHVDALINLRPASWRLDWAFELGGIALIAAGALTALLRPPDRD